jgi:hypothetical protein
MADRFGIDTSEVHELAQVLGQAAVAAPKDVRPVVEKGALNIKKDARRRVVGISHAPTYPYTITYDSHVTPLGAWAEIGPDKEKHVGGGPHRTPGNLGGIFEFGGPRSAPIPHMYPAGEAERPKFERALEDLAAEALEP